MSGDDICGIAICCFGAVATWAFAWFLVQQEREETKRQKQFQDSIHKPQQQERKL